MKPVLRRVAALALLIGAVFVGGRLLGVWGGGPVPVEIHYLLGDPPRVAALEVDLARTLHGEAVAHFETKLIAPDVKQSTRLPAGTISLDITLVTADGRRVTLQRTLEAERGVVVKFQLAGEVP